MLLIPKTSRLQLTQIIKVWMLLAFMILLICAPFDSSAQTVRSLVKKAERAKEKGELYQAIDYAINALNSTKKAKAKFIARAEDVLQSEYPEFTSQTNLILTNTEARVANESSPDRKIQRRRVTVGKLKNHLSLTQRIDELSGDINKPTIPSIGEIQKTVEQQAALLRSLELQVAQDYYDRAISLLEASNIPKADARKTYHLLEKADQYSDGRLNLPELEATKSKALKLGTVTVGIITAMENPGRRYNDLPSVTLARLQSRFRLANNNQFLNLSFGKSTGADFTLSVKILDVSYDTDRRDPKVSKLERTIQEEGKAPRTVKGTITKHEKYAQSNVNLLFTIKERSSGEVVETGGGQGQDIWSNGWATLKGNPEVLDKKSSWHGWLKKSELDYPKPEILAIDAINIAVDGLFIKVVSYINSLFMDSDPKSSSHGR